MGSGVSKPFWVRQTIKPGLLTCTLGAAHWIANPAHTQTPVRGPCYAGCHWINSSKYERNPRSSCVQAALQVLSQFSGQMSFVQLSRVWFAKNVTIPLLDISLVPSQLHRLSEVLDNKSPYSEQCFIICPSVCSKWTSKKKNLKIELHVILRKRCKNTKHFSYCNARKIFVN